jgi:flagellar protein FlaJ
MAATASATTAAPSRGGPTPPQARAPLGIRQRYREFCYRVFGARIDVRGKPDPLTDKLKQAGMNETAGMHRGIVYMTTIIAGVVVLAVSLVLFLGIIRVPLWFAYVAVVTAVGVGVVPAAFRFLISSNISNRKGQLERELPFTLSELSVLASTGMSPIDLVRRIARRDHDPALTAEFKKVIYKTDIQGKDLITALGETAKESPSNSVRETLWDLANMIHQGGSLDEYLRTKSEDVLKLKRGAQREFVERLNTFVDMYISLVLISVLMIGVGAFLINAFNSTALGLDANALLLVLTFGLVPLAVVMTTILVGIAYARSE